MYNNLHGVFELIEDAIDAAYEAQHILEAQYTTEDRQKFIDNVKAEALKVVNEETIKEFEEVTAVWIRSCSKTMAPLRTTPA